MNNNLAAKVTQSNILGNSNSLIPITVIVVIGLCYCVTITTNAKYSVDTELKCGKVSLKTHNPICTNKAVPA